MQLIKILKSLGDETRLRILHILYNRELCVCEIQYILSLTQSNTSRHLKNLSDAGLVVSSKKAQWVSYKINEAIITEHPFIKELLDSEVKRLDFYKDDLDELLECKKKGIPCNW